MRRGAALLIALLCCFCGVAFAGGVPDKNQTGAIGVSMRYDGAAVPGGTLTLYHVGAIDENNGDYSFVPTGDFADCGYSLARPDSAALARSLATLAKSCAGTEKTIGSDGTVKFENLEPGLYLLVQATAADGYSAVEPFLVTVPMLENGVYVYEVDATPKVELEKKPEASATPKPEGSGNGNGDGKLPQTGQLNWPVPVMATTGVCMFTIGWKIRFKKNENEK